MNPEELVSQIYDWHKSRNEGSQRGHLGASLIGDPCGRKIWYSFRWASPPTFTGRHYRMFNRGIREEPLIYEELRGIGFKVSEVAEDGSQHSFKSIGGHFAGSADGIVEDKDGRRFLLEIKTAGKSAFNQLVKHGVHKSKPVHFGQMQTYMGKFNLPASIYIAVCKDDDRLHIETIEFDPDVAEELEEKADYIITSDSPPARMSQDPAFWLCKMCQFKEPCFGLSALAPSCRTCTHSTPTTNSQWACRLPGKERELDLEAQKVGCHEFRPIQ